MYALRCMRYDVCVMMLTFRLICLHL